VVLLSLHLARGTHLKWIENMGGWASAKLLLDLYGHFLPTESSGFADALSSPTGSGRLYPAPGAPPLGVRVRTPAPKVKARHRKSLAPRGGIEPPTRCLEDTDDPEE